MRYWQVNKHFLKILRVVAWIAASLFVLLYLVPLALFRIPAIQEAAARRVGNFLTELFDSPVQLQRVRLTGWTDIEVQGVTVLDTAGREMLKADRLVGGMTLSDLIYDQEVRITSARLFSASLSLIRDAKTGRLNIQHTIDHLSKPKKDGASMPVDINSIIVRDLGITLKEGGVKRVVVDKLSTRIRRLRFSEGYIGGAIDELSFSLQSGFQLSALTGQAELRNQLLTLRNIQAKLPDSKLSLPLLTLDLRGKGFMLIREAELADSDLALSDLAFLYPSLKGRKEHLALRALYSRAKPNEGQGNISLEIPGLFTLEEHVIARWNAEGQLQRATLNTEQLYLQAKLITLLSPLLPESTRPYLEYAQRIGSLSYQGELDYNVAGRVNSSGMLRTDQGKWSYQLGVQLEDRSLRQVEAELQTEAFRLAPFLGETLPLDQIATSVRVKAKRTTDQMDDWQVETELTSPEFTYRGYTYRDLNLSLRTLQPHRHEVKLNLKDPNATLEAEGAMTFAKGVLRDVDLSLKTNVHPEAIGLTGLLGKYSIEGSGAAHIDELNADRGRGLIALESLTLTTEKQRLSLRDIQLQLVGSPETGRLIHLSSPYLTAQLSGRYTLASLLPDLKQSLRHYFPSLLVGDIPRPRLLRPARSSYELELNIQHIPDEWVEALHLPVQMDKGGTLRATYQGTTHELTLYAQSPLLRFNGNTFQDLSLNFADRRLQLSSDIRLAKGAEIKGFGITSHVETDSIHTRIDLGQDATGKANGLIGIGTHFSQETNYGVKGTSLSTSFSLAPSRIRINGEDWTIAPAQVQLHQGQVRIYGLDLSSTERRISIDGALSNQPNEYLNVALRKINLLYILQSAGVTFDMLDTELTGNAKASLRSGVIQASAEVSSPAFYVKGVDVGALRAGLTFDSKDGRIMLRGHVAQADGGTSDVEGYIRPAGGAGIDLRFDATRLRADFVGKFMDTLFDRVEGRATGKMRLFGVFEDGVTVEGSADVEDGCLGVRLLGTRYFFSKQLTFTPTSIQFNNIPARDDEGHTGLINGEIRHRYFGDFELNLEAKDLVQMKVLQTKSKQRLPFYGTAYGTGWARLKGKLPRILLEVNMHSAEGTDVTLDFNKTDVRKEDRLMVFKPLRPQALPDSLLNPPSAPITTEGETELSMRMALHVTPEARLALRLGSSNIPNEVKARCEGDLTIDIPHTGAVTTYGGLTLHEGSYVFNFEQLTRRRFTLREGGTLNFRGDPMQASIDLKAVYSLTANIADLDAGLSTESKRTHMPVNCTLQLSGIVAKPDITLGLELPGAEVEVDRRVQSLVNTQDERNRQVLYLMTLGKFYTPENRRNTKGVSEGWATLATTTLSEQLTHLLGNFSRDIQLGTNIRTSNSAFEDTDIELLFSGSWLNDRLIINGNVGYHDNPFLQGKYIGEFDLEYKLNHTGTLRLKAYNHYNNMYQYLRQSLTTQGLGFMFQRRFDSFSELVNPKRKQRKKRTFASDNSQP